LTEFKSGEIFSGNLSVLEIGNLQTLAKFRSEQFQKLLDPLWMPRPSGGADEVAINMGVSEVFILLYKRATAGSDLWRHRWIGHA
jgi:hypothetical protein